MLRRGRRGRGADTWVGRSLERVEDEALLRGEGRFIDDLEPVPHAWHAAIVRSQLAHARVTVDPTAALAVDGVRGVLTGDDVARLSKPFPAGIESPVPHYAAAVGTARYVGEPLAVVVARDRYVAEDAAELVAVDYEPLEPVLDPARGGGDPRPLVPLRGRRRGARDGPTSSSARRSGCRGSRACRSSASASSATGTRRPAADRVGELPGAVHAPRRRRRRARPPRRPAPAPDAARLGRLVRDQGGGAPVRRPPRARVARARRARALDGGPARAPRRELGCDRDA